MTRAHAALALMTLALLGAGPARAGFSEASLSTGGVTRTYSVYSPEGKPGPLPAVFVLHGGGGTGRQLRKHTSRRFESLADKEGFLVIYPDGLGKAWNDGRGQPGAQDVDDRAFLGGVADALVAAGRADPRRLHAVGISNGGFMAHVLACGDAARWASVSAVVASLGATVDCRPVRPVPILMVNGTEDRLVPWDGEEVRFLGTRRGRKLTVPATAAKWAALDGCAAVPVRSGLPDRSEDGVRWSLESWPGCRDGAEVLLYKMEGGGHTWPGGTVYLPRIVGRTSRDVDFESMVTEFFRRHPLPAK